MTDILIKSFNRAFYLDRCLYSIHRYAKGEIRITVLDDGTPSKYLDKIKEKYPEVVIKLSAQHDYKVNSIRENIESGKEIDGFKIPTDLWMDSVSESTDYVFVTEDDVWVTQEIDFDLLTNEMKQFDIHLVKLGWLGNQDLKTKPTDKKLSSQLILMDLSKVFSSNQFTMDLLLYNKFKIYSILYRFGLSEKFSSRQYWQLNSILMGLWKKEYWLHVWKDAKGKVDEKQQLRNSATWLHKNKNNPNLVAHTQNNFLRTTFQSSATNSYHQYGFDFDVNYFNHLMNEAWIEGKFDSMKDFPNDFTINYFEKFMDDNIDKKEFHLWVENFKNQYRKSGYLID